MITADKCVKKAVPGTLYKGYPPRIKPTQAKGFVIHFFCIKYKKKRVSMNKTTNLLQGEGWLAKYSLEVRVILLQGTTFHLVNRLVDKGAVDNVSSPKRK